MSHNFQRQIDYLLTYACSSTKYLVHRDMLGTSIHDPFMISLQNEILAQANTQKHLSAQHPDGWFGHELHGFDGLDADGRYVDTPDISWTGEQLNCGWWKVDEVNVGIPYGWGNASTIEEFEAGIRNGKYAGNVPEDKKRHVSHNTVGVDCSGLLTVCWELPKKIATRDIPAYASIVDHLDDIQQGDVFAKVGSHVMFFKEFADADKREVVIIDATRSTGKVSQRTENVAELFAKGYVIYRKNR